MTTFGKVLDSLRRDGEGWTLVIPRTWANGRTVFGGLQVALSVREMRGALDESMGAGKGNVEYWFAPIQPGRMLYEIEGIPEATAREAFRLAAAKLSVQTTFVVRTVR